MIEEYNLLKQSGAIPLRHQTVVDWFKNYKQPNYKIHRWIKKGYLIQLSKGLYMANPDITGEKPDKFLISNALYGPSYVTAESALAMFGAIPEEVHTVTAVTTKRTTELVTPIGRFSYVKITPEYYSNGIEIKTMNKNQNALCAIPEKAICDLIVTTKHLLFRSKNDVRNWIDYMRLDELFLNNLDPAKITAYITNAPKKSSLNHFVKLLKHD